MRQLPIFYANVVASQKLVLCSGHTAKVRLSVFTHCLFVLLGDVNTPKGGATTCVNRIPRMREAIDGLLRAHVVSEISVSGHLLLDSDSFRFETEKDAADCRALNRIFITVVLL